ncbi:hypothetical protein [Zhongshania aliphaticivorans]|uniref:hypothetical protein n=1 Tax=Zhongshania aliphaticivorans TaxID=1470434 RepID=UPI0012E42556|nr:hypothetical protein [Zhongshania aliphaticivorans]CAA0103289.1 Uncharacterised protein [Zhongshania aliphaticivorans]
MSDISPDRVLFVLSRHIGEDNGVSVTKLAQEVTDSLLVSSGDERAIRAAVVSLRKSGHHVCAHPGSGYFLASTELELVRSCSYLFDRAMCSLEQVAAMRRESLPDLRGQLRLPT